MTKLLNEYGVQIDQEAREFFVDQIAEDDLSRAAMRFVAFSLRVRDFRLMTEANIASTFRDDVRKLLSETIRERAVIEEDAAILPTLTDFNADFVIRPKDRPPVGVFLGTSDTRILEALFAKMRAEYETHDNCAIVGLLERGKSVSNRVRQQATNRLAALTEFRGDEVAAIQRIAREALGTSITLQ